MKTSQNFENLTKIWGEALKELLLPLCWNSPQVINHWNVKWTWILAQSHVKGLWGSVGGLKKDPRAIFSPTFQQLLVISPISTNLRCDSTRAARFKTGILRLKKNFNEFLIMMLMLGMKRESLVNCMAWWLQWWLRWWLRWRWWLCC